MVMTTTTTRFQGSHEAEEAAEETVEEAVGAAVAAPPPGEEAVAAAAGAEVKGGRGEVGEALRPRGGGSEEVKATATATATTTTATTKTTIATIATTIISITTTTPLQVEAGRCPRTDPEVVRRRQPAEGGGRRIGRMNATHTLSQLETMTPPSSWGQVAGRRGN